MKTWKFLVSQNGWEYAGMVLIKANSVECKWNGEDWDIGYRKGHYPQEDGNTIVADGIEISFDEGIEFCGEFSPDETANG